jgi:hypothetical protein
MPAGGYGETLAHGLGIVGSLHSKGSIGIGDVKEQRWSKTLTAANIKALRATPFLIAPNPGTGTVLIPVTGVIILRPGTNVLTEATANLVWRYRGQATPVLATSEMTGFIDQATAQMIFAQFAHDLKPTKAQSDGLGIELFNNGAAEFGGNAANDAILQVYLTCLAVTPGW